MSAAQFDDEEALRRAQKANEPSMDEILASIRAIIADDKAKASAARAAPAGSQVIYSAFGQKPSEAPAAATAPTPTPTVVWSRPEPEQEPEAAAASDDADEAGEDEDDAPPLRLSDIADERPAAEAPLLSDEAGRDVTETFRALSATFASPDPERVEAMTRELLRPMLKAWLDENLPSMVERLVKAEIQRVARGGR